MSARAAWRLETLGFVEVYRYHAGKMDWAGAGLPIEGEQASIPTIGAVAAKDVPICAVDERIGEVRDRARSTGWELCVVVNDRKVVLGLLERDALDGPSDRRVDEVMEPGPTTYRPNLFATDALHYMHEQRIDRVLVTTSDGELMGVLRYEDLERSVGPEADEPAVSAGDSPYRDS